MRAVLVDRLKHGCLNCGLQDIRVLEFDHVRGTKVDSISEIVRRGLSWAVLRAELAKCEVRCRNCHRLVTLARLGRTWLDDYVDSAPGRN